jgi:hypothetical protein
VSIVDILPLWAAALVLFVLLIAACWIGIILRSRAAIERGDDQGYILSAALGLLALIIAFTFSLALNRYDLRRGLVVQEANAIGTTYLRADLAPEPYRDRLRIIIRHYVDARLALAEAGEDGTAILAADTQATQLQQQLWQTTMAALPAIQPAPAGALLVGAVNDTIDLAATRKAALEARLPASVIAALVLYALISAGILGHATSGNPRRSQISAGVLFVLLTLAITLILDLDRPRVGSIVVSQAPLLDLKATLNQPSDPPGQYPVKPNH